MQASLTGPEDTFGFIGIDSDADGIAIPTSEIFFCSRLLRACSTVPAIRPESVPRSPLGSDSGLIESQQSHSAGTIER